MTMYIKETYKTFKYELLCFLILCIWCEVGLNNNDNLIIEYIYCSPSSNKDKNNQLIYLNNNVCDRND